jgi:hypothetical protein
MNKQLKIFLIIVLIGYISNFISIGKLELYSRAAYSKKYPHYIITSNWNLYIPFYVKLTINIYTSKENLYFKSENIGIWIFGYNAIPISIKSVATEPGK